MARWICFCLIFLIFLFWHVKMIILADQYDPMKRHLGSARENRYRAKQRTGNSPQKYQQQTSLSPEFLRARWLELYNEQNQT